MATTAPAMPPSPPGSDSTPGVGPGTGTPAPASTVPSPAMESGTRLVIGVVNQLRAIAQAYPAAAPLVAQINDLMREVQVQIMKGGQQGEPQAGLG